MRAKSERGLAGLKARDDRRREATLEPSTAGRGPSLAHLALAGAVGLLLWLRWGGISRGIWVDLDVYVRGAAAVTHREPLYSVSVHGLPFTYPPFAAVVLVPFELLGQVGAQTALTVASIGCYVLVVAVCARRLRMGIAIAGMVGLVGMAFEPFMRTILLGQINLVLMALVVLDCLVMPPRYRGMLIGLATGIKILPGAFILFLVLKREWWAVGRAVAAFAVTVAVGGVFAPRDTWLFWSGGLLNLSRFGPMAIIGGDNQTLSAALMRLSHDISPPSGPVLLMSVGVMALGVVAAKRQVASGNDVNALVCIAFASLLASPIAWTHHWVWAVLAAMVLVQAGRRVAAFLLSVVFVIAPMWLASPGHLRELGHNWWQATGCISYALTGLTYLIFFAFQWSRFKTGRRPPDGHRPKGRCGPQTYGLM
jgi:alpha-1,2-mannosyltransferase